MRLEPQDGISSQKALNIHVHECKHTHTCTHVHTHTVFGLDSGAAVWGTALAFRAQRGDWPFSTVQRGAVGAWHLKGPVRTDWVPGPEGANKALQWALCQCPERGRWALRASSGQCPVGPLS